MISMDENPYDPPQVETEHPSELPAKLLAAAVGVIRMLAWVFVLAVGIVTLGCIFSVLLQFL